ncbi:chorismate pyruvate-lyase family protein [Shimazuella sp. AN120528]|uniref:chorismate pyruvate-lyase family protein n=1 Tax=Shimazuella soli TaxID=1892854 RepID=UPI001F107C1E|nr:chorismate pyruvate-lyase family protein [Shimazuella soli]MCH5586638.1 chorismate pyruvate-lyase family protein [Shimazuella soli]
MKVNQIHLNKLGKFIVQTTSSITKLIEIFFEVQLKVKLINQHEMIECPKHLKKHHKIQSDKPILREICLIDSAKRPFIYAETLFYKENISVNIVNELYDTETPIGKIIEENKLEFYREILEYGFIQDSRIAKHLGVDKNDWMIYKVCSTIHQAKNVFLICEYFPINRLNLLQ